MDRRNTTGSNAWNSTAATAVPSETAVYDHRRTGIVRNSRNRAVPSRPPTARDVAGNVITLHPLPPGRERRRVDRRIAHLILGTRGGLNRGRILSLLRGGPRNANAIA